MHIEVGRARLLLGRFFFHSRLAESHHFKEALLDTLISGVLDEVDILARLAEIGVEVNGLVLFLLERQKRVSFGIGDRGALVLDD